LTNKVDYKASSHGLKPRIRSDCIMQQYYVHNVMFAVKTLFMAAPPGRRPLCVTGDVSFFLLFSPPNLGGYFRSSPNFVTCSTVTHIYKIGSKFLAFLPLPPQKNNWRPKTSKFRRDFGQLRDLITNISGLQVCS